MMSPNRLTHWLKLASLAFVIIVTISISNDAFAQMGQGRGQGFRDGSGPGGPGPGGSGPGGQGRGQGMHGRRHTSQQNDQRHHADQEVFHYLLANHDKIKRTVKELPNGVETLTESETPEVAAKIKEHVEWMSVRIKEANPIRMRDPLFAEIFRHTDKIKMQHEGTDKGVRVIETSDDPTVVILIQAHAKVVTGFVERGFAEARKNHPVPSAKVSNSAPAAFENPVIPTHGSVVRLANAVHQPREGTKVLIDITHGGEPAELSAAIEKVAKYLNIYAGGGAEPVKGEFAVVFHGDATLVALNDDAYSARFNTKGNPNLDLLHQLHEQGVDLFVCGQTLISTDAKLEEVAVFIDTAVSALTVVVNLQSEGYAHLQLGR